MRAIITGSGSFIPDNIKTNEGFIHNTFYDKSKSPIQNEHSDIIDKFQQITGIRERRYADTAMNTSSMAVHAANAAMLNSGVDPEKIDQIIVAHNFGDVLSNSFQPDTVPSLAARVKHQLGIKNPSCVAYDILFGCPGWLQGLIQANAFIKAGAATKCLVIGAEALSRVIDPHDRDSMIYSDGAGAVVIEINETDESGIIGYHSASYSHEDIEFIFMGKSNCDDNISVNYLKMQGRKVYEFALKHVPLAIKSCLEKCNVSLKEIKKIFIHQANEKMDEAILKRLYKLYNIADIPPYVMPMNIQMLGNSSVATIPTLYDMVKKNLIKDQSIHKNDLIVFASVGAGMNINAVCYRV